MRISGGPTASDTSIHLPPKFRKAASEVFEPHKKTYVDIISAGHNRSDAPECGNLTVIDAMNRR